MTEAIPKTSYSPASSFARLTVVPILLIVAGIYSGKWESSIYVLVGLSVIAALLGIAAAVAYYLTRGKRMAEGTYQVRSPGLFQSFAIVTIAALWGPLVAVQPIVVLAVAVALLFFALSLAVLFAGLQRRMGKRLVIEVPIDILRKQILLVLIFCLVAVISGISYLE